MIMKQQIEQFIKDWTPLGMEEITEGEFKRDVHKLIQAACQEQQIKEREDIFEQIAEQFWGYGTKENDGNISEMDIGMGYNKNGVPNSVGYSIYGRNHSDLSFTDTPLVITGLEGK